MHTLMSVEEILWCENSNQISLGVRTQSTNFFSAHDQIKFGIFVTFYFTY